MLDSLAGQFAGRARIGKVNIQEEFDLASQYGIQSVPRVLLFHRARKPSRQVAGFVPEAELAKMLESALG